MFQELNDAVKIITEGSEVLDSLKPLEDAGVEMFSCGTCLGYYGLRDKLKIGLATIYRYRRFITFHRQGYKNLARKSK